ncbi:MAG: class I SAM-dependent methyltransferase [Pseudomonadota bacterium]
MKNESTWETIYAKGSQLNRYPYSDCISFFKRRWPSGVATDFHTLDVGCGSGVHADFFASQGAQVTAFDFSPSAIQAASELFPNPAVNYLVASFDEFDPRYNKFDLVFDRLATTCSSMDQVERFYQKLLPAMSPGGKVFWQGFDWGNSGRSFGTYEPDLQRWNGFTSGVFEHLGPTVFFKEEDLDRIFAGYGFESKRVISDRDTETGYTHSYWMLELSV